MAMQVITNYEQCADFLIGECADGLDKCADGRTRCGRHQRGGTVTEYERARAHLEVARHGARTAIEAFPLDTPTIPMNNVKRALSLIESALETLDAKSIRCPNCSRTSYNVNDVINRYCGYCHKYHDQMGGNENGE